MIVSQFMCRIEKPQNSFAIFNSWKQYHERGIGCNKVKICFSQVKVQSLQKEGKVIKWEVIILKKLSLQYLDELDMHPLSLKVHWLYL